jgi:ferredoxin
MVLIIIGEKMFNFLNKKEIASSAIIEFIRSNKRINWSISDGSLLALAQRNNIEVNFSCCQGYCCACVARLVSGDVFYQDEANVNLGVNEILLCSAKPLKLKNNQPPVIKIDL